MTDAYTGGCACGAIRYEIPSEPVSMLHYQCRHCQQRSGTGHGSYLAFMQRISIILHGDAKQWSINGDSGVVKGHHFCATCGTPVYMTFDVAPDVFVIHAASLDDPKRFTPQKVMFSSSAQGWDTMDPSLQKFERMPPK